MIRAIVSASVALAAATNTNTNVTSIGCDVCTFALEKAYGLGCSWGGDALSAICLDAAPICEAAFEALCQVCDKDCNVGCWSQWACAQVDVCPSVKCEIAPNNVETINSTRTTQAPSTREAPTGETNFIGSDDVGNTASKDTASNKLPKQPQPVGCYSWDSSCVRPPPTPGPCFSWDSTCVKPPPQPRPTCYSWDTTCVKPVADKVDTLAKTSPIRRRRRSNKKPIELQSTYDGGDTGSGSGTDPVGVEGPCWSTTSGCVPIPQENAPKNIKLLKRKFRKNRAL